MSGNLPAFALPRFTAEVDCEPIGYPGLTVHFWLNVTVDAGRVTDADWAAARVDSTAEGRKLKDAARRAAETKALQERPPWERDYYYSFGRIVERITLPAAYVSEGDPVVIEIPGGKELYDLMGTGGFDQTIINWAASHYYDLKQERLASERKN